MDNYFKPANSRKSCPSCREQGLSKNNIKPSRAIQRLLIELKVKCPLQLKQNKNSNNCLWNGELSGLDQHINIQCGLGNVICNYCEENMKRYQLIQHNNICPEKPISCDLNCGLV